MKKNTVDNFSISSVIEAYSKSFSQVELLHELKKKLREQADELAEEIMTTLEIKQVLLKKADLDGKRQFIVTTVLRKIK